jgi:hypothetical protein
LQGLFQASRAITNPLDDKDNFVFDIYPNRLETVKFEVAQRKLCDYVATRFLDVSKIFSHGIEVDHPRPQRPRLTRVNDPHHFRRDEYKEKLKLACNWLRRIATMAELLVTWST